MKPQLLLISGWAFPPCLWNNFVRHTDPFARTIILDPLEVVETTTLLNQVIDTHTPFLLGGWSLGSLLVMQAVLQQALQPHGLILMSGTPSFCSTEGFRHGTPPDQVKTLKRGLLRHRETSLTAFHKQAARPHTLSEKDLSKRLNVTAHQSTDRLVAGLDYLLSFDVRSQLAAICQPTLILHGSRDTVIPQAAGEALHQGLPNSSFVPIPDAGHDIPFSAEEILIQSIARFVETIA